MPKTSPLKQPARHGRLGVTAAAILAVLAGAPAGAQQEAPAPGAAPREVDPALEALRTKPVRRVLIVTTDASGATRTVEPDIELLVRNQLRLREGFPFDPATANDDLQRLNRLGRFRTVESSATPLDDGGVAVTYRVVLQPLISAVQTVGNTRLSDQTLSGAVDLLVGTPVDRTQLDRAAERIRQMYVNKGYANARVSIDEKALEESGVVLFRIREGVRTRVSRVTFAGNNNITERELHRQIETEPAGIFEKGILDEDRLEADAAAIVRYYRDRGYIDCRCAPSITPAPNASEALVEFIIEEGEVYTLRDVKVSFRDGDAGVFTPRQLVGLMTIKPGQVYSERDLRTSLETVEAAYGKLGYADVRVNKRELRAGGGEPKVDLLLVIDEGRRFRTGLVEIVGNRITRDDVVRRMIPLKPDRPLDATQAREAERRIEASRLFARGSAKVAIQPEASLDPFRSLAGDGDVGAADSAYRDVIVEVSETNTGSFNFGATAGSDGGLGAFINITESNFDVTDPPDTVGEFFSGDSFRGGGQTFAITLAPGDRVRNFAVSLTEPSLGGSDYSGSAEIFYRQRLYRAYDENRYGSRFTVGRRFGSLWTMSFPLRFEWVSLGDIDPDAPTDYFEFEDLRLINSLGVSLRRSSTDTVRNPTSGTSMQFGLTQFGLLGDETFTEISAEAARYFKLEEDVLGRSTTLLLRTSAAYIPGDEDVAPFFERQYLGGQSFRGFAFRGVSPVGIRNDTGELGDDPIGGNWLFFAGAELNKPLFEELVSGVAFIDTGTVEPDLGFDSYRVSVGLGLRLHIEQLSNVPLAFDFGFPILKEDTDRERLFTFSLEVPFR